MQGRTGLVEVTTSRTNSGRNTVSPEGFKAVILLAKMTGHEPFLFTQEVGAYLSKVPITKQSFSFKRLFRYTFHFNSGTKMPPKETKSYQYQVAL